MDGLVNSLFIIKTALTDNVYGGFISKDMRCNSEYSHLYDENAFMFSLINSLNTSFKMNIMKPERAMLLIGYYSNIQYFVIDSYKKPDYINNTINLFGTYYEQIEVYTLDGK